MCHSLLSSRGAGYGANALLPIPPRSRRPALSGARAGRASRGAATACLVLACSAPDRPADGVPAPGDRLFTALPSASTGVRFENRVTDTRKSNVFTYRNYYNGGGVALGDLTGDGLPELFLTANLGENRLYLNEGGFRFRDVTGKAGVGGTGFWSTGVTFADVNGDGLLDIYVCRAGEAPPEHRANALYVHQGLDASGVPRFTEQAEAYGVADEGYSTHAAFFDYDRDGDLDLYVVNNSPRPVSSFGLRNTRDERHPYGGDRLYRNDGGHFVDVSSAAGIYGSEIAFGLGIAVGDVSGDGWPDIYVSNDFFERDFLYINNRDGTFAEQLEQQLPVISLSSMGLDMADVDNDGRLDLYVMDMLPEDDHRFKTTTAIDGWDGYQTQVSLGFHHQFTRNMLQRNNGNGTFSEVGQLAGIARTDWSWSPLIADLDLDGHKDIYVTTGIIRDVTAQDYIAYLASEETMRAAAAGKRVDFLKLIEVMHSTPLPNYAFRNEGHLTFANLGAAWGLNTTGFSNGAAYGDLDGDGAPDLVVNNMNAEASVYRNNARALLGNRFLQLQLEGEGGNRFGIGAKVVLQSADATFVQELMPSRGFQSSVDYVLTFGLGARDTVPSVTVAWPDGRVTTLQAVAANQRLTVKQADAAAATPGQRRPAPPLLTDATARVVLGDPHRENKFVDFRSQPLMPMMLSTQGPLMAVADVNGDGWDDAFVGGAREQPGQLLLQRPDGSFASVNQEVFRKDALSEDVGAAFFDATGDGHPDLYVVSGGSDFAETAPALQDRLYLNDGRGGFRKADDGLPSETISGSRVVAADFDADGDTDLFVGGRVVPRRYGIDPQSMLLENDGRGRFRDVTARVAPELARVGMVTDAVWHDVDHDGRPDLVVVGEWMPITLFHNAAGGRLERVASPALERSHGWWTRIVVADVTGDGRDDFVVGNLGLNSRLRASATQPVTMHVMDADRNGSVEQVLSIPEGSMSLPLLLRDDLLRVVPSLRSRYPDYESYAGQTVADIFPSAVIADAVVKQAETLATTLVRNDGDGAFTLLSLPLEAQLAPVYGILPSDVDGDGNLDLLLAGNFDGATPAIGRMRASYGLLLRGDNRGAFTPVGSLESGFVVPGQARDIQRLRTRQGVLYVVTRNNDRALVFRPGSPGRATIAQDGASAAAPASW